MSVGNVSVEVFIDSYPVGLCAIEATTPHPHLPTSRAAKAELGARKMYARLQPRRT